MKNLQERSPTAKDVLLIIESLKKRVLADRCVYVKVCCPVQCSLTDIFDYCPLILTSTIC